MVKVNKNWLRIIKYNFVLYICICSKFLNISRLKRKFGSRLIITLSVNYSKKRIFVILDFITKIFSCIQSEKMFESLEHVHVWKHILDSVHGVRHQSVSN